MKAFTRAGLALAIAACASFASAADVESGLQPGKRVGAFQVVKAGGATADGVKLGQQLCYR